MNPKNTCIVLHNIRFFSGTQFVDWELDVVYVIRKTNIKIPYVVFLFLYLFIFDFIIVCTNLRRRAIVRIHI